MATTKRDLPHNAYSFPRIAVMLGLAVAIGLLGANCGTGKSGDDNPRPNCGTQADGTKDCVIQKGEQRFGGGK